MKLAQCAKRKKLDEAETLYNRVISKNTANRFTDAIMVNVYVQCGHVEKAHDLLQKIRSTNNGFVPGVVTCTSLLKGFCSNGMRMMYNMKCSASHAMVVVLQIIMCTYFNRTSPPGC